MFTGPNFGANGTIDFQCVVIYNGTDPEQVFEVVWTFNGQPHPSIPSQLLLGEERVASLDISLLQGQVDTRVSALSLSAWLGVLKLQHPLHTDSFQTIICCCPPICNVISVV